MTTNRRRFHEILEMARPGDRGSRWFDIFIMTLISLNILDIVLESVQSLNQDYRELFYGFEVFSVVVFSVEYLLRLWSCVEASSGKYRSAVLGRLRLAVTPMALVDLLAVLPFYLAMFFTLDLRFLRALRLLRVFKLTRYSPAMNMLLTVLREETRSIGAACFILMIVLVIASSGIYLFEHRAQPDAFGSIPEAVWWAVATLTTVGYGDVTPITIGGKAFGVCIMIIGVGMVALPAGILASAFSEQSRKRREDYADLVDSALEDGKLTPDELRELEFTRKTLGLREEDAEQIMIRTAREEVRRLRTCPHCHKPLDGLPVTDATSGSPNVVGSDE